MNRENLDKAPFSTHRSFWAERKANRLAEEYFGKNYGVDWDARSKYTKRYKIREMYPTYE